MLRRRWPPRFVVSFDQLAALLVVNLATWALLDYLHAEPHAAPALDGLFGWACYLLLGLAACGLIARVQDRAAHTRSLLVPALAVAPFVLIIFWLALDVPLVSRHPLLATLAALVYLVFLTLRVLGAAFGPVSVRPALLAVAFVLASP
ncbi:MAG TPA: hypothetical protein VKB72_09940, partial [Steroidobacteraceae bacterium]|nr:hypothetical protein [Steroidobacteraceae bacterium]